MLLLGKQEAYLVKADDRVLNVSSGIIKLKELIGKDYGCIISTHKGAKFVAVQPNLLDFLKKRMKRKPQVINPKDIALVIAFTGIRSDSRVLEAGTGSGYATLTLGVHCSRGKVYSYELRKDFYSSVKQNLESIGLKNVELFNKNVLEGVKQKNLDLVLLDMKDAESAVELAYKTLKPGAFLVVYSPYIEQVKAVTSEIANYEFTGVFTVENMLRVWDVGAHTLPQRSGIMHTGFLTFARKLW